MPGILGALADALGTHRPGLLFSSACCFLGGGTAWAVSRVVQARERAAHGAESPVRLSGMKLSRQSTVKDITVFSRNFRNIRAHFAKIPRPTLALAVARASP